MNPGYKGHGRTEVWCFVIPGVGLYYACADRRMQWITWCLLAVFDLHESLVGTTSEVFRLLFGASFLLYWGVFGVGKSFFFFFFSITYRIRSIKAQFFYS